MVNNKEKTNSQHIDNSIDRFSFWNKIGNIPHYFFYWYYPKDIWGDNISSHSLHVREMIERYLNGKEYAEIVQNLTEKLIWTFGEEINSLVMVMNGAVDPWRKIPVLDPSWNRYLFIEDIITRLGINYYRVEWIGGLGYEINRKGLEGKHVVIFDEIMTQERENDLQFFANKLEDVGIVDICAISIGKKVPINSTNNLVDPWENDSQCIRDAKIKDAWIYEGCSIGDDIRHHIKDSKIVDLHDGKYVEITLKNERRLYMRLGLDEDVTYSLGGSIDFKKVIISTYKKEDKEKKEYEERHFIKSRYSKS